MLEYKKINLTCPICKNNVYLVTHKVTGYDYDPDYYYNILCKECGIQTEIFDGEKEAIKKWNNFIERTTNDSQ